MRYLQWLEVHDYTPGTIEGRRDALERVPIFTEVSIEQLKAVRARTHPAEAGRESGPESEEGCGLGDRTCVWPRSSASLEELLSLAARRC